MRLNSSTVTLCSLFGLSLSVVLNLTHVLKTASASPHRVVVVGDLIGEGSVQEQSVVGKTPNLAAGLQAFAATPDPVDIAGQPRSSE